MQKKKTETSEERYGGYGNAFNFTRGDLEANRAGFITMRQRYVALFNFLKSFFWLSLGFALSVLVALVSIWLLINGATGNDKLIGFSASFFALLFAGLMAWALVYQKGAIFLDMRDGRVKAFGSYEDYSKFRLDNEMGVPFFPEQLLLPLRPRIRIYTLPRTVQIVSVEILDTEEDALDAKEENI
jgi:hypothetical protein